MKQCTCYALRAVDCTCMPAKYEEIYEIYTTPDQEPVAWRTFDGEGGYDYRTYDTNEDYADEWEKRNPNHKGWVEPLYKDPKPCPTCEALARTVMLDQTSHDTRPQPQRTEQEPVAWRTYTGRGYYVIDPTLEEAQKNWPDRTHQPLYTTPQPKQEQGEPVAWTIDSLEQEIYENTREFVSFNVMEWLLNRLNTTPQQRTWVGLTDEEILSDDTLRYYYGMNGGAGPVSQKGKKVIAAIEAKLKEKNGYAEESI